jgi:hypothetical protein
MSCPKVMENDIQKLQKQYAALAFALGVARGALSDVVDGDFTAEEMQRVYEATAPRALPRASVFARMHLMFIGMIICQTQRSIEFKDMMRPEGSAIAPARARLPWNQPRRRSATRGYNPALP